MYAHSLSLQTRKSLQGRNERLWPPRRDLDAGQPLHRLSCVPFSAPTTACNRQFDCLQLYQSREHVHIDLKCSSLWLMLPIHPSKMNLIWNLFSLKSNFSTFHCDLVFTWTVGPVPTRSPNVNLVSAVKQKLLNENHILVSLGVCLPLQTP